MTTADMIAEHAAMQHTLEQIADRVADANAGGSKSDLQSGALRDISELLEREGWFDDYCLTCWERKSDCECSTEDDE